MQQNENQNITPDITTIGIEGVTIKKMPSKQEYLEGDNLDLNGLLLCVKYNDGSEQEVTDLDNGAFLMCRSHTQTGVNLTYAGHSFRIPVTVKRADEGIEMTHVFLATPPTKPKFIEGDPLDFTGAQLMLQYSNGTRELVDVTPDMVKSGDCTMPGENTVIIEYQGHRVEETIIVYEREIDHLEIVSPPEKTKYIGHEPVNVDGLALEACYNNGDRVVVGEFTVLPEITSPDMNCITIQYRNHKVEFPITVEPVALAKLDWESLPEKRNYFVHEKNFSCNGGVLRTIYNTGEIQSVPLCADMVSGFYADEPGQCTIIAAYEGQTLPFTVTIQDRQLLGIQIMQKPRTFYMAGELFNPEGMKVEAIYSGGGNEEVEFTFHPDRPLRSDDNFIVIAYKDKAAMLDLTVTEPEPEPEPEPEAEPVAEPGQELEMALGMDTDPEPKDNSQEIIVDIPTPVEREANEDSGVGEPAADEGEQEKDEKPVKKVEVPHFYPSTFCIRFQENI